MGHRWSGAAVMISVPASEVQRNFSEYEEKAVEEPVEVTHPGRSPSYLVSERLFKDMMSSYRRAIPVEALSDGDIALIEQHKTALINCCRHSFPIASLRSAPDMVQGQKGLSPAFAVLFGYGGKGS
jgi:PHD/YefM family antitoxin component YafN of YafNO toxin-antitoxin module